MTDEQSKKVDAEIANLIAQTAQINKETSRYDLRYLWLPMCLGWLVAGVALAKLFQS